MRWADIVLSYLRAVAWPVVIIIVIWLFRRQIKTLILSARRVTAFGAEAEFADLEKRVKQTESQLGEPINYDEEAQPSGTDIAHRSEPDTVGSISYIDLGDLDSLEPIAAAIQVTKKLQEATSKVLRYFGVPENAIDPTSAGAILAKITGVEQWTEFVPLVDELGRAANVLAACQNGPDWFYVVPDRGPDANMKVLRESGKKVAGASYRLSKVLPTLVERSLRSASDHPERSLSVTVYVDGSTDGMDNVIERVDNLVRILGYGDYVAEINEKGSFFRTFTAMLRRGIDQKDARDSILGAERAIKLYALDQHLEADTQTAKAIAQLITALGDVPTACVRIGAILIIKYSTPNGPVTLARVLSQPEARALEQSPEITREPDRVLERLALAIQSADPIPNADN